MSTLFKSPRPLSPDLSHNLNIGKDVISADLGANRGKTTDTPNELLNETRNETLIKKELVPVYTFCGINSQQIAGLLETQQFCLYILFKLQKTGRVYQVGNDFFEIEKSLVEQLIEWNTAPVESKSCDIDRRIIQTILLALLPKEKMVNDIDYEIVGFVRGKREN